ncbi:hypothetical protein [Streptomyces sp. DH24]|uniref:hypothetical protein n=1 Tax=Streptomyces sp. DH24 TaxID=3040123 RepID=UPI002442745C|nr:hypothetical protein [Streptomyces sp. DH24]MDG9719035.1 hypothetical protein [Streptomyces sp. DH24]
MSFFFIESAVRCRGDHGAEREADDAERLVGHRAGGADDLLDQLVQVEVVGVQGVRPLPEKSGVMTVWRR